MSTHRLSVKVRRTGDEKEPVNQNN